jgi:CarD family transcriptional regulator
MLDLRENDWIVHATHGVGKIKGMETKQLRGEKRVFYIIQTDKLTYWLPILNSDSDRIRSVGAPSTFQKLLSTIRAKPVKLSNNFRVRVKHINDEIAKCSLTANAKLIRDLHARNSEKSLHVNEHRIYENLKTQFINEWSVSAELDKQLAEMRLRAALQESLTKYVVD